MKTDSALGIGLLAALIMLAMGQPAFAQYGGGSDTAGDPLDGQGFICPSIGHARRAKSRTSSVAVRRTARLTGETVGPPEPTSQPGKQVLAFDPHTGLYTYVWKTEKSWAGTCRVLILTLGDHQTHTAFFKFK